MGWTGVHKPKHTSAIDFLKNEWSSNTDYEIIETAMNGFTSICFAVRHKKLDFVFAVVYLTSYNKDYHNFTYKSMDEFCGPNVNCPKKILKLLTPVEEIAKKEGKEIEYPKEGEEYGGNGYYWAMQWRKRSEEAFNKKSPTSFRSGDMIKLDEPMEFKSGSYYQYFKKVGRTLYALDPKTLKSICIVRIRGFKHCKFTKLSPQDIGRIISE